MHHLLVKDNVHRFRRRVRRMQRLYANREIEISEVRQRLMSWAGHARQVDIRERLLATIGFQKARAEKPRVARRVVQQQRVECAVPCCGVVFRPPHRLDRRSPFFRGTAANPAFLTVDYLHENASRKGLVTRAAYWRFLSAAYYFSEGKEACDVNICAIDWT